RRIDLKRMALWTGDIGKMNVASTAGILMLDARPLKNNLAPIPTTCSNQIKEHLHRLLGEISDNAIRQFRQLTKQMQQLPRGLAEYCEYVVLLGTMGDAHEKLQSEVNAQDELKELSEQQGVKLAIEEIDADAVASGVASVAREAGILTNIDAEDRVARRLKLEIDDFKPAVPIISALCVKAMQPRHQKKLFNLMGGKPWKPGCNLTELLQMNILQFKQQVLEISATANGEYALESQLEKIKAAWK
ncbi:MAG: hypothetical protein EZS28_053936, partial [Streblomastix strix]